MPKFVPEQESELERRSATTRGNRDLRRCDKCHAADAQPYFTTSLKEVRSKGPKRIRNKQPRWYCQKHRPKKVVSPTNGKVYTIQEYDRLRVT